MALSISPLIRFGTSPGRIKAGSEVYTRQYPENKFVQKCLGGYCQYQYQ